jgi:hypothetical protein
LAEHLSFNTKSRMQLLRLRGRVIQVHGPVWRAEQEGSSAVLWLGNDRRNVVRAHFACARDLQDVRKGQEVVVVGMFGFRGTEVTLEDASLGPSRSTARQL